MLKRNVNGTRISMVMSAAMLLSIGLTVVTAQDGVRYPSDSISNSPIQETLANLPDDVRVYNEHVTFLANPFCEGRFPGTQGMEVAKEYVQFYMERAGLTPAFINQSDSARDGWRQPFSLGEKTKVSGELLGFYQGGSLIKMMPGKDFAMMPIGQSGTVDGSVVFVGYSLEKGPEGSNYSNYRENTDLTGKVAFMFRFEPMDEEGHSRWSDGRWSSHAGFQKKIKAAVNRGAAAVVIVNTPGANDERAKSVNSASAGQSAFAVPIMLMSTDAAELFLKSADTKGRTLMELRKYADEGGKVFSFRKESRMTIGGRIDKIAKTGENVAGILQGRGRLAGEYIVIGAHLDHLGMGEFGSQWGSGKLHPGADDNASGSSGILLVADKLSKLYRESKAKDLRSIILMTFSGEESGLDGSRYYANHPIVPISQHVLMMNIDMIGRIEDHRFSVAGAKTGEGMAEFIRPFFEQSELEIIQPENIIWRSDHASFYRKGMPILFGMIAKFHTDYHTPGDVSWKLNRADAVKACNLWVNIAMASAEVPTFFKYKDVTVAKKGSSGKAPTSRMQIKVRFGIIPGNYGDRGDAEQIAGVLVDDITPDSSAANGGIEKGDRLVKWNGEPIKDIRAWMGMLAKHNPGDVVAVTVMRDDVEVTLQVKLQGRDGGDG